MHVLIIGSLSAELGIAARIAIAKGVKLDQCDDQYTGLARLRGNAQIDLVMCDMAQDIARLVHDLKTERIRIPVVACGLDHDPALASKAIHDGASEFLPLPPDPDLIAAILEAASGDRHILIARDPLMLSAVRRAEQVAASEASVFIKGESGVGKEVMARYLHSHSRRSNAPFIALNCAAIPEALLESELFGHEKGAFSGAVARRIGKFESAEGGTLLLDEISEMDVRLQAKLLRAIQEREIDRLGGGGPVRVNVRLLATSNRDLPAEVSAGRFREDLFFRLNVVDILVPPLRDRPNDIAALAEHFARHYADLNGIPRRRIAAAAYPFLAAQRWRGNVRELENTIHRAVLLANGPEIDREALQSNDSSQNRIERAGMPGEIVSLVGRTVFDVERELIIGTLAHTLGNRTHAAAILGISIRALRNKLNDYVSSGHSVPPPTSGVAA
jgi:DNA-binding NtrC family response regulator